MPIEMAVWRITPDGPRPLDSSRLDLESTLEDMIVNDSRLLGTDLLVVGRQVETAFGGFLDVLCIDVSGRLHALELKRDKTPRDVVAQVLDYGSWVSNLTAEDLQSISARYNNGATLENLFVEHFGEALPDVVNIEQRFTIVASELDVTSERLVQFLAETYAVPINAVFFRHFADGESSYLARTWLIDPAAAEASAPRRAGGKVRPWNGKDYYVIQGTTREGTDRWSIASDYGFLSAGGGSWYSKPLQNLKEGNRVFAYVGGAGYVGVGEVIGEAIQAIDAMVLIDGEEHRLLEQSGIPESFRERALSHEPDEREMVVPVRWLAKKSVTDAIRRPGLFASQVTVCKLRDERTIEVLEEAFRIN
jgi:hypothetical protein